MTIREYDSMEAMLDDMRRAEEEANKRVIPQQREIGYGDHWWTWNSDAGLYIFGHISTEEETTATSRRLAEDEEEANYEIEMLRDSHARGYRFGWAYSVACPEGELGSTHIASMAGKLTEEEFDLCRAARWVVTAETMPHMGDIIFRDLARAKAADFTSKSYKEPT